MWQGAVGTELLPKVRQQFHAAKLSILVNSSIRTDYDDEGHVRAATSHPRLMNRLAPIATMRREPAVCPTIRMCRSGSSQREVTA